MFMKNILVCIKAVPAALQECAGAEPTLQRENISLLWNIADQAALEAALQLRRSGGTVTVLTMGPSKLAEHLRELLGRGVDHVVLLSDPCMSGADTYVTANTLTAAIQALGCFDLILCGRRSVDGETGQVPSMLGASLGMPCITNTEWLQQEEEKLVVRRRLENGTVTLSVSRPAVVSVCEYAYFLRMPGIAAMRQARGKQVQCFTCADLGLMPEECGLKGSLTKVIHIDQKYPGLRKGKKETDISDGVRNLLKMCDEVRV